MDDVEPYDLEFRPADYRDLPDPIAAVTVNVKGQIRRELIRGVMTTGEPIAFGQGDEWLYCDDLGAEGRRWMQETYPNWIGGENLPDYRAGEVEIARLVSGDVRYEVISVRARATRSGWSYRMVDEYGTRYTVEPRSSRVPLTLRRLIGLIDGAQGETPTPRMQTFVDTVRSRAVGRQADGSVVRVESVHYPGITAYYREDEQDWVLWRGDDAEMEEEDRDD